MQFQIPQCYDSHCHFLAVGQIQLGLKLFDLKNPHDVSKLKTSKDHFAGDWLLGFGWDQHKWAGEFENKFPTKEILDKYFPDFPVAFSRADGHALWVNSKVLEAAGQKGTGVFMDADRHKIDEHIPPYSLEQKTKFLKNSMKYFNDRGFTHVRDMSCTLEQWKILRELDQKSELSVFLEANFTCANKNDFEKTLNELKAAKKLPSQRLRALGLKIFYDGALGSEGALLSQPYGGSHSHGFSLWNKKDLVEIFKQTWSAGFEICVHTIGDEAAHQIAEIALDLKASGVSGRINFEHAQVLRPETIEIFKNLDVVCHMQPCHFLSDRLWLKEKLGKLYGFAFPWRALQKAGIKIQFGSDAPIEEASVQNNLLALKESATEGIAPLSGDLLSHFSHPDQGWGGDCVSEFST